MEAVFLFCRDAGTGPDGKMDIHGVFNELLAPDFPAKQDRMVGQLEEKEVEWALIIDHSIDGRADLRFANSNAIIWQHLQEEFQPVAAPDLPGGHVLMRRAR